MDKHGMEKYIGKKYDLLVFPNVISSTRLANGCPYNPNTYQDIKFIKYNNVRCDNINGLGMGQVHFTTEDGSYLLLPWGMIFQMVPHVEKSFPEEIGLSCENNYYI